MEIEVLDERSEPVPSGHLRVVLPAPGKIEQAPEDAVPVQAGRAAFEVQVHVACNLLAFFESPPGAETRRLGHCAVPLEPSVPVSRRTLIAFPGARVVVQVSQPDGEPISGATVAMQPAPEGGREKEPVTDARGEAHLTAPVGNVEFKVHSDAGWAGGSFAFLHPGEERRVEITARRSTLRIRVRCTSAGGSSHAGRTVGVRLVVGGQPLHLDLEVDGEGQSIAVQEKGRVWASVTLPDGDSIPLRWRDLEEATAGTDELVLPLGARAHLTLRLRSGDGDLLPDFRAQLVHQGPPEELPAGAPASIPFQSDGEGEVVLPKVCYGTYALAVGWGDRWRAHKVLPPNPKAGGGAPQQAPRASQGGALGHAGDLPGDDVVPSSFEVRGEQVRQELEVRGTSILAGKLEGGAQLDVATLSIQVEALGLRDGNGGPLRRIERAHVAPDGRFTLALPVPRDTEVRMRAVRAGLVMPWREWRGRTGQRKLLLRVEDAGLAMVEVSVRSPDHARVLGWLRLFQEADEPKSTPYRQIDPNSGSVTFTGLSPGSYRVEYARAMRREKVLLDQSVAIRAGTQELRIELPR